MAMTNISWAATPLPDSTSVAGATQTPAGKILKGYTFNPWWGCVKLSPACDHCYAAEFAKSRGGNDLWAKNRRQFFGPDHWLQPGSWNRKAKRLGLRLRVFTASMADIFERLRDDHPDAADMLTARAKFWNLIRHYKSLDWLLLTKRPSLIKELLPMDLVGKRNVWLGFTAEDQDWFNRRWPFMIPFAEKGHPIFVSIEPQLGPIELDSRLGLYGPQIMVICGGESGARSAVRQFDHDWAASLRDQCQQLGVRFHMKQFGSLPINLPPGVRIKHPHGSLMTEWPEDLKVREWAEGIPIDEP